MQLSARPSIHYRAYLLKFPNADIEPASCISKITSSINHFHPKRNFGLFLQPSEKKQLLAAGLSRS